MVKAASLLSSPLLLATFLLLLLSSFVSATNNITKLLQGFSDYSSLSSSLSKYGVASEIDSRDSITVLCPSNSVLDAALAALGSSPSRQTVVDILSYHVLLDYFDLQKIDHITNGSALVTTLFQTTGLAAADDGFVNITDVGGSPRVGLPTKGSKLTAAIGKELTTVPYNISLLTIDSVLVPVGAAAPTKAPTPAPASSPTPASSPAPASVPTTAPASVPTPAPASSPTPSSAQSPASVSSPTPASAPSSLSPESSSGSPVESSAASPAESSTSFAASVNLNGACLALIAFIVGVVSICGL